MLLLLLKYLMFYTPPKFNQNVFSIRVENSVGPDQMATIEAS